MSTTTNTFNPSSETKRKADEASSKVGEACHQAVGMAENIKAKAEDVVSNVGQKAQQAASSIGHQAEDATHAVGSGMKSLADTVRQKGPHSGIAASATSSLAQGLERGGQYLEEQGLQGIAEDVTNLIRRNPIPALLLGIGLGFMVARATMRR